MLKGDAAAGAAMCSAGMAGVMENGLAGGASCLDTKEPGETTAVSALTEKTEGAAGRTAPSAGSAEPAAAKGLMGKDGTAGASCSDLAATWNSGDSGDDDGCAKAKGEAGGAAVFPAAACPSRACTINPGSFDDGSGTIRGSWGEMAAWNNAGHTRNNSNTGSAA